MLKPVFQKIHICTGIAFIITAITTSSVHSAEAPQSLQSIEYRCISTGKSNFLMLKTEELGKSYSTIMYYPHLKPIKISLIKKRTETVPDRPSLNSYIYKEYIKGKPTGIYTIRTQGAKIEDIQYHSNKTKKSNTFIGYGSYNFDSINKKLKNKGIHCL